MKNHSTYLYSFLLPLFFILVSCNTTEPPINHTDFYIIQLDVGVSEVYLYLHNSQPNRDYDLLLERDNSIITAFNSSATDTVIVDTSLNENRDYTYKVSKSLRNEIIETTNEVTIKTLEATSHNFTWQTYEFGDFSSILYDVAIIDENSIWAVGEIFLKDENGDYDSEPYGLARWNGSTWSVEKVQIYDSLYNYKAYSRFNAIYSFGINSTFIASSANLLKWDFTQFDTKAFFMQSLPFTGQVTCMWGTDENNIYLGSGSDGTVYNYYGSGWKIIYQSENDAGIADVIGYVSPIDNKSNILASSRSQSINGDNKILVIDENNNVNEMKWDARTSITSTWTRKGLPIYSSGDGVYKYDGQDWKRIPGLPSIFTNKVLGTKLNDIFVVGAFGLILHFNGMTWQSLVSLGSGALGQVAIKDDIIAIAGREGGKAVVKIGRRN